MPVTPTYPGVYIQELPSGVHTITGVATSVAAFIDFFPRGPLNTPVQVFSFAEVQRIFGGLDARSEASFGLDQFFRNGGTTAWVVRVSNTATPAVAAIANALDVANPAGVAAMQMVAASPGRWGNSIRVRVDPGLTPATFDVVAREVRIDNGRELVVHEVRYAALSAVTTATNYAGTVINDAADNADGLIRIVNPLTAAPAPSGYVAAPAPNLNVAPLNAAGTTKPFRVTLNPPPGGGPVDQRLVSLGVGAVTSIQDLAARIQGALRSAQATGTNPPARIEFTAATATVHGNVIQIVPGVGAEPLSYFFFDNGTPATLLNVMGMDGDIGNVAAYALGDARPPVRAQSPAGTPGADGDPPAGPDLIGTEATTPATGMFSLNTVDIFNLLCLPRVAKVTELPTGVFPQTQVDFTVSAATDYAVRRRAMLLLDPPSNIATAAGIRQWMVDHVGLRNPNVALHFPRLIVSDPTNAFRDRGIGASGAVAGLCGRIDTARGVWKAPAGTETTLSGVSRLEIKLTNAENGTLNPIGINCLRTFDTYGNLNWGARTTFGEDVRASDWKYLPVRRLALYLEETLLRATQWVIFEPNDEPLWAQIRLSVGAFMADLFRKGAFQGKTRQDAYFVHCDSTTTTSLDQQRGIVNLVVGFAPLKPAEFLIISIQQLLLVKD
jgi:phage tail sheath protein FI